jgi:folate-binding protein YgfZ
MPLFMQQNRALLAVRGTDAAQFLQGLITQDVLALTTGQWMWSGLLSPQGKVLFDFLIRKQGDDFILDVEAVRRDTFIKKLNLYKLRAAVVIEALAAKVIVGWNVAMPADAATDARHGGLGWRGSGDAPTDDHAVYMLHRWSLGIAEGAEELGIDQLLWLETNAGDVGGASFTKGCYIGQENTARMHHRAKLRKRLMVFESAGSGDALMAGDKLAGEIMCQHGSLGVALVRLDYLVTDLTLGDAAARLHTPDWLEPHLKTD